MPHETNHAQNVAIWLSKLIKGRPPEEQLDLFCEAFNAMWRRSTRTLGVVTIHAIADRSLHLSSERYPLPGGVTLGDDGIDCNQIRPRVSEIPLPELEAAIAFALTQFLTIIGRLTAEILTPALHAELSAIGAPDHKTLTPAHSHGDDEKGGAK